MSDTENPASDISSCDVIELDWFDTAFALEPAQEDEAKRRFMTLLAESGPAQGNIGCVRRVRNAFGETFALKYPDLASVAGSADVVRNARVASFFEEYRNQLAVAHLHGFPHVYGYGSMKGTPVIVMEWVCGSTLAAVTPQLPHEGDGVAGATVCALGIAIAEVLEGAVHLDHPFVHRDLSPANIMVRTDRHDLARQVDRGAFDVCLIDMGSSTRAVQDASFTMLSDIWRNGTPEYAAPEMLTRDVPGVGLLRQSPSIDIYALCSVLYELYAGHTPFRISEAAVPSYYLHKMKSDPLPLAPRKAADERLVAAILSGIRADQAERPSAHELLKLLRHAYDENVCMPGTAPTDTPSPTYVDEGAHLAIDWQEVHRKEAEQRHALKRARTRRAVLAGAGAAAVGLVAAGIATRGFGIVDRMRGIKGSFAEYSWEELIDLAGRIAAASDDEAARIATEHRLLNADGTVCRALKRFELADGTPATAQLLGLRADERADGTGVSGLTLLLNTPLAARAMHPDAMVQAAWEASEARAWLDGDARELLPRELADALVPVRKMTNNAGAATDASCVTATEDTLWLPSYAEIVGKRELSSFNSGYEYIGAVMNEEGLQYQAFLEMNLSFNQANEPLRRTRDGDPCFWWLRSPSPDVSLERGETFFNRVGPNGDPFHYACEPTLEQTTDEDTGDTYVNTLMPGFCL